MMRIGELLDGVDVVSADCPDAAVEGLSYFAHKIRPGWAYVACDLPWMPGYSVLGEAVDRGASVVVVDREADILHGSKCCVIVVRDSKKAYSTMCANFFGNVHRRLSLYAVTGTKGKTSTCHILESIFGSAGIKAGLIGTVVRKIGDRVAASTCTTPDPFELHGLMYVMRAAGVTHVVLEASSIGISEKRLWGLHFDGMIFTNLGREHLTYHGGMENYRNAKARLFTEHVWACGKRSVCALNVDDPFGAHLASVVKGEVVTYGTRGEVSWSDLAIDADGISGEVCGIPVRSPLLGPHNAHNVLGAVALSRKMGLPAESITEGVSHVNSIPGRLERVSNDGLGDVFVDYAHTPESVQVVLETMKKIFAGRPLVTVIGCGGGTDRSKRPVMAKIAAENSDACIFTSDNPRHEDPLSIIEDMLAGVGREPSAERGRLEVVADRREAIHRGVEIAGDTGALVILGKGHERFQIVGNQMIPFDDREVAAEALRLKHLAAPSLA
jgi:UDP-N-acetylmuramoyl-L-alanyl-D-glutamate--2,6-diaminopimelate ligase